MSMNDDYRAEREDRLENGFDDAYERLPDGEYEVDLLKLIRRDWDDGGCSISWEFRVRSGEHEGRVLFKNSPITDQGIKYFAADMVRAKFNLESLDGLDYFLPMANEDGCPRQMVVRARTKGKYQAVYINECEAAWFPFDPKTGRKADDPF